MRPWMRRPSCGSSEPGSASRAAAERNRRPDARSRLPGGRAWFLRRNTMPETMKAPTSKEEAIRLIQGLPDDCTLEDIQNHLFVRQKVEQAMANFDDGAGWTQDEAERRMAEWLKSS